MWKSPESKRKRSSSKQQKNGVVISAEHLGKTNVKNRDYVYNERSHRSFYRRILTPQEIIPSKINAKMTNGILNVELPKKQHSRPDNRRVKVNWQGQENLTIFMKQLFIVRRQTAWNVEPPRFMSVNGAAPASNVTQVLWPRRGSRDEVFPINVLPNLLDKFEYGVESIILAKKSFRISFGTNRPLSWAQLHLHCIAVHSYWLLP